VGGAAGDGADYSGLYSPAVNVLFDPLTPENFPDLFTLLWVASLVLLVGATLVWISAGRRHRRYPVLLAMHEWMFWSVLIPWVMVPLFVVVHTPLLLVLLLIIPGLAVMLWARFVRFPPLIAAANREIERRAYLPAGRVASPGRARPAPAGRRRRHPRR
jgi:hypothetical protein